MTQPAAPMKVTIVSDDWWPQVNGVVRSLTQTKRELEALGHTFCSKTRPMPLSRPACWPSCAPTSTDYSLMILRRGRICRRWLNEAASNKHLNNPARHHYFLK